MNRTRSRHIFSILFAVLFVVMAPLSAAAQSVKRVVIVKVDGLPGYYVDEFIAKRDPQTGKSVLPWFAEVFYKNGTRIPNFYTRGMSLSAPSWGQLDTGRHLQIKGNVEYDRYTQRSYDYLNFFPFYVQYGLRNKADMPGTEVLDQLEIPLLFDAFKYEKRYTSQQLFQRGNEWEVLAGGFVKLFPRDRGDLVDEWTMGLEFSKITLSENEHDIVTRLTDRPDIDYFDYYDFYFDHISHGNNDTTSRLIALKQIDRVIGKIWTAIGASSRAGETALVLVSDHGMNSDDKIYSQGFNLVKILASSAGGGHHVGTKRRHMQDYSLKGLVPMIPLVKTTSKESTYLDGQSEYTTALVDFDGNERSSIHLRNSDLNMLQILLQQLQRGKLSPDLKQAAQVRFFDIIDRHRSEWQMTFDEMGEELDALHRWIVEQEKIVATQPVKFTPADKAVGIDKQTVRLKALMKLGVADEASYREYRATLGNLLALDRNKFSARSVKIADVIAPGAMGDANSLYQLQNYIAGPSAAGLALGAGRELDDGKSFGRVNYFDLLQSQRVRNNVQPALSSRPIDFLTVRLPARSVVDALPDDLYTSEDPIWLYGGVDKQALILSRTSSDGELSLYYLPVADLKQDAGGKISFQTVEWSNGVPLKYFEDARFAIPVRERSAWLKSWHTEHEWLNAVHKTMYSNAIIGLNEQLIRKPVFEPDDGELAPDERLIRRFRKRQRLLTEADLLIMASNHWNFDLKGFNAGGNHGGFFRVSTNSALMFAGGVETGIPRGLLVEQPYDGLSFVPTILRMMGKIDGDNRPVPELSELGFERFPGRVIKEVAAPGKQARVAK